MLGRFIYYAPCAYISSIYILHACSFERKVAAAMQAQTSLWLRYNTASVEGGGVREVIPERWIIEGFSFYALCVKSGKPKQYHLDRIRQASEIMIQD